MRSTLFHSCATRTAVSHKTIQSLEYRFNPHATCSRPKPPLTNANKPVRVIPESTVQLSDQSMILLINLAYVATSMFFHLAQLPSSRAAAFRAPEELSCLPSLLRLFAEHMSTMS